MPWVTDEDARDAAGSVVPMIVIGVCLIAVLAVLLVFGKNVAYQIGWATEPLDRTGVENVKQEARWFHEQAGLLQSSYANLKALEQEAAAYGDPSTLVGARKDQFLQLQRSITNARAAYNHTCGQYQAAHDNFYRGSVAPRNVPRDCAMVIDPPPGFPTPPAE